MQVHQLQQTYYSGGDFDSRGSCMCVEAKDLCSLYFSLNFAVNLNLF